MKRNRIAVRITVLLVISVCVLLVFFLDNRNNNTLKRILGASEKKDIIEGAIVISEEEAVPEYVSWEREHFPGNASADGIRSDVATLYINAGKKEKISRGDVAGFLMQKGGLAKDEVGKIVVGDHNAIVAVPRSKAAKVVEDVAPYKLKNTRVKVSVIS